MGNAAEKALHVFHMMDIIRTGIALDGTALIPGTTHHWSRHPRQPTPGHQHSTGHVGQICFDAPFQLVLESWD